MSILVLGAPKLQILTVTCPFDIRMMCVVHELFPTMAFHIRLLEDGHTS